MTEISERPGCLETVTKSDAAFALILHCVSFEVLADLSEMCCSRVRSRPFSPSEGEEVAGGRFRGSS